MAGAILYTHSNHGLDNTLNVAVGCCERRGGHGGNIRIDCDEVASSLIDVMKEDCFIYM